ncbi:MAG: hypothetical protein NZ918_05520, partial [Aigarchaeota archaeon]|nr:hypothetical protein [Aigarchaeota archaeon]
SSFEIVGNLRCKKCGETFTYYCLLCNYKFQVNEHVEYCPKCGWFRCPQCNSCGCFVKALVEFWKSLKKTEFARENLKVRGFMSSASLDFGSGEGGEDMGEKEVVVTHFFYTTTFNKRKRRKNGQRLFQG